MVRAEWRTPVRGWERVHGRAQPGQAETLWQLPDCPLPYFTGQLGHLTRNLPPGR